MSAAVPKIIQDFMESNKRAGGVRVSGCEAQLTVDGQNCKVKDFSRTGFEASLPELYRRPGMKGSAKLVYEVCGYRCYQDIEFEVRRLTPNRTVGATYEVTSSHHEKID